MNLFTNTHQTTTAQHQSEVEAWEAMNTANGCKAGEVSDAPCTVCGQLVKVTFLVFNFRTGSDEFLEFAHLECLSGFFQWERGTYLSK